MLEGYRFHTADRHHRLSKRRRYAYGHFDKSLPLFVRSGDLISENVIANGYYEPEIKALINHCSAGGCSDFFVDIGANIGLTSCQSGGGFREVHLFEPNPDCLAILGVNIRIAIPDTRCIVHPVALGRKNENLRLFVPKTNWGGAFIKGPDNAYDDVIFAQKDGYESFDVRNYSVMDVAVVDAQEEVRRLFEDFQRRGLTRGVAKVDVEGYEAIAIEALMNALPENFTLAIIFENWASTGRPDFLRRPLPAHRLEEKRIVRNKNSIRGVPNWINSLYNRLRGGFDTELHPIGNDWTAGTYVIGLTPKGESANRLQSIPA